MFIIVKLRIIFYYIIIIIIYILFWYYTCYNLDITVEADETSALF